MNFAYEFLLAFFCPFLNTTTSQVGAFATRIEPWLASMRIPCEQALIFDFPQLLLCVTSHTLMVLDETGTSDNPAAAVFAAF